MLSPPPTLTHHQAVRAAQNQSIALGPKTITAPGQHKLPGQCGPATQTSSHAPELFTRRSTNAVLSPSRGPGFKVSVGEMSNLILSRGRRVV